MARNFVLPSGEPVEVSVGLHACRALAVSNQVSPSHTGPKELIVGDAISVAEQLCVAAPSHMVFLSDDAMKVSES